MENLFCNGRGWRRALTLVAVLFLSLIFTGCASTGGNRGSLQRDRDIDFAFYKYEVLPDHNYYTSGGYDKPNAILAIHKDYELVTDLWQSIPNVNSAQVRKWIDTISPKENYAAGGYNGAYIISPEGKKAGVWYSIQDQTVIKFPGANKIVVYTPDLLQPGDMFLGGSSDGRMKKFR